MGASGAFEGRRRGCRFDLLVICFSVCVTFLLLLLHTAFIRFVPCMMVGCCAVPGGAVGQRVVSCEAVTAVLLARNEQMGRVRERRSLPPESPPRKVWTVPLVASVKTIKHVQGKVIGYSSLRGGVWGRVSLAIEGACEDAARSGRSPQNAPSPHFTSKRAREPALPRRIAQKGARTGCYSWSKK